MKYKLLVIFVALFIIAAGCPQEVPDLVNPPSFKDSVNVRLVNLTTESIELLMNSEINTGTVDFLNISPTVNPPSDSAIISINQNGNQVFEDTAYYQFTRSLNFAFVSLPVPNSSSRAFDTVISLSNLGDLNNDFINATVKVLNAIPDTNQTISIQIGCPGGEGLANFLSYRQLQFDKPLQAGEEITVSMVKTIDGITTTIGTYAYTFDQGVEYTLIASLNENGEEDLFVLDENRLFLDQAQEIPNTLLDPTILVEEKFTNLRILNLLDAPVDLSRNGEPLFQDVSSIFLSDFVEIPACVTTSSETFTLSSSTMQFNFSPVVNENYTMIAYRSQFTDQDTIRFIEPASIKEVRNNRAAVKTINLLDTTETLTISLGSNTTRRDSSYEENGEIKTVQLLETNSGFTFASRLFYGSETSDVLEFAGIKPFNIFNSAQPASYKSSFTKELESNRDYILLAYKDNDEYKFSVLDANTPSGSLQAEQEGVLTSFVNAHYNAESITIKVGDILENVELFQENTLTTILPEGINSIDYNGNQYDLISGIGERNLLVFEGNSVQVIDVVSPPNPVTSENFFVRNIHAAYDLSSVRLVIVAGAQSQPLMDASPLSYTQISEYEPIFFDADMSLQIVDSETLEVIFEQSNLPVTRGKNFTFIISGKEGNYNLLIQQEF